MTNYTLLSIPAYSFLCLTPHFYAFSLMTSATDLDNTNPHGSAFQQKLQKALGAQKFAQFERAESAHRNNLENAPLFFAAVLAAVFAERTTGQDLGSANFAGTFLGLRVAYNLLYVLTEKSQAVASLRSISFMGSVGLAFYQIYKSAVALG